MVNWQDDPSGLYIDPAAPDGAYLVYKSGIRFSRFFLLVDGDNTAVSVDTGTGQVAINALTAPAFLVTRVPGGDPSLVFDTDGEVVHTEVLP